MSNSKPGPGPSSIPTTTPTSRLQFQCTYEILNTLAVSSGLNGRTRAAKGVVLAKKLGDGTVGLWVSKNKESQSFLVKDIKTIRKNFIAEGKLTIEFNAPPINLMLRDVPSGTLVNLVQFLGFGIPLQPQDKQKASTSGSAPASGNDKSSPNSSTTTPNRRSRKILIPDSTTEGKLVERQVLTPSYRLKGNPDSTARPNTRSQRALSEEMAQPCEPAPSGTQPIPSSSASNEIVNSQQSQVATADLPGENRPNFARSNLNLTSKDAKRIRKTLRGNVKTLKIDRREDVPLPHKNYPSTLTELTMNGIGLRRIDARISGLRQLHTLKLTDNRIQFVEVLKQMTGRLGHLTLANNEISQLPGDLFDAPIFQGLTYLDLSGNELVTLPCSISELVELRTLHLTKNKLRCLPYDIHKLRNLQKLHVEENNLEFLPFSLGHLSLSLSEIDVSNNPILFSPCELKIDLIGENQFPTLFELTSSAIANINYKSKLNTKQNKIQLLTHEIPPVPLESIQACKLCLFCQKMVSRYKLTTRKSNLDFPSHTQLIGLISGSRFNMKIISCENCFQNSGYDFIFKN